MPEQPFKDALRAKMAARNLRSGQLAALTGLSQPQVSQYLTGKRIPSEGNVRRIAAALDWPLLEALHSAGRHDTRLAESEPVPALAEIAEIMESLDAVEQEALCSHLRVVARSWVAFVLRKSVENSAEKVPYSPVIYGTLGVAPSCLLAGAPRSLPSPPLPDGFPIPAAV